METSKYAGVTIEPPRALDSVELTALKDLTIRRAQAHADLGKLIREEAFVKNRIADAHKTLDAIDKEYLSYDAHLSKKYEFAPGTRVNLETGEIEG